MVQARVKKNFRLPHVLIDAFDRLPINRSAALAMAVMNAGERPAVLAQAFERRLIHQRLLVGENDTGQISASVDPVVVTTLQTLTEKTDLPIEQTLRLAMEAYLYKL